MVKMKKEFFYNKIKALLGEETDDFFKSLELELHKGIRYNKLKINKDEFLKTMPFAMEQILWCDEGFYLSKDGMSTQDERPGKHPYYYAGLYYLQEPSAMLPAEALEVKPGDRVLDISAAPGGKSTQIAAKLQNTGILVSNDINPKRAIALHKNISLFGVKNSIVLNQRPEALENVFSEYFDKILVDAPCSGEGLIKKDLKNYEADNEKYVVMQKDILNSVQKMLKEGGELVYSTCTFSPEENEGIINWFINTYKEFEVIDINIEGLSSGRPEWIDGHESLVKVRRAWPHKLNGEGHFIARLKKNYGYYKANSSSFNLNNKGLETYYDFASEYNLDDSYKNNVHNNNGELYLLPNNMMDLKNIKTMSIGLNLGEIKNNKFTPSQELALCLNESSYNNITNLNSNDVRIIKYLKGETIEVDSKDGWSLMCVDGYSLGWGKVAQGVMKNYYKKQWRML